jgi:hypothetical protein
MDIATRSVVGNPSLLVYRIVGNTSAKGPATRLVPLTALVERLNFVAKMFSQSHAACAGLSICALPMRLRMARAPISLHDASIPR